MDRRGECFKREEPWALIGKSDGTSILQLLEEPSGAAAPEVRGRVD